MYALLKAPLARLFEPEEELPDGVDEEVTLRLLYLLDDKDYDVGHFPTMK